MENNYTPNSNKYKKEQQAKAAEPKVVQKVVSGQTTIKKKTGFHKLADTFVRVDAGKITDFVVHDVLLPTAKKTILTIVDMMLYGDSRRDRGSSSSSVRRVNYNSIYDNPRDRDRDRDRDGRPRSALDYDDIEFNSRGDAVIVLDSMCDILDRYGVVTIADYYDLAGQSNHNTCIHKYGWTNLSSAKVVSTWGGKYIIEFPKAMPI